MARTTSFILGDYFEGLVAEEVASGHYSNASEVMRESLRLFDERRKERNAKIEALRTIMIRSEESGNAEPFDLDRIKANVRKRVAERNRTAGST